MHQAARDLFVANQEQAAKLEERQAGLHKFEQLLAQLLKELADKEAELTAAGRDYDADRHQTLREQKDALGREVGALEQKVESFQEAVDPVSIVLALDASGSMAKKEADVVASATEFISALRPDDQLALVEPYRAGTTLRALIDTSGRLPVELAVRVACDAAAGLGALHAVDPGDGQPMAHGALTAERIASRFVLESLGERTFKNVSQPLAVYRVIPPGVYSKVT